MEIILGRSVEGDNTRKIDNAYVSSKHCRIYLDESTNLVYIEDLNSTNGTYVNGILVKRKAIAAEDKLLLGGQGGYETTLSALMKSVECNDHSIESVKRIYEEYQHAVAKLKTNSQLYSSIRIVPSALVSVAAVMCAVNDKFIIAILSFLCVVVCLIVSTILIRKNDEKMRTLRTRFQMTYVCPKTRRWYGDKSWEVLQNESACPYCKAKFR